jgi:alpha-mannosidase
MEFFLHAPQLARAGRHLLLALTVASVLLITNRVLAEDPVAAGGESKSAGFSLEQTPLFVRKDGKLLRVVDAVLTLNGPPANLIFHVEYPGLTQDVPADQSPASGLVNQELLVPDSDASFTVKVTAQAGSYSSSARVKVDPCRKWKIFAAASAHTDIGYTDLQPKIAELHNENIDRAIAIIKQYPDFRWNVEAAWEMENYLASRPEPQRQECLQFLRDGKLGVQATYANTLTGLLSDEAATRFTWSAAREHRLDGVPYDSAMTSDVPSLEGSVPTILADSGISYFSEGMNATHSSPPFRTLNPDLINAPCWWEGLDGSRVLMVFASSYYQARILKLDANFTLFRLFLNGDLKHFGSRPDYPYDAIFLHGAIGDNMVLEPVMAQVGAEWNKRYAYPQVIFCTNDAFFKYLAAHYDLTKLPLARGSAGTCWEDGAASSAQETRLGRNAQEMLASAEKLFSLASRINPGVQYPSADFNAAWRNCLLYDEHTWGARTSVAHPHDPMTLAQWKIKAQYAIDANQSATQLLDHGLQAVATQVKHDGPALVVVNPSNWPRSDVIRTSLPAGLTVADPSAASGFSAEDGSTCLLIKDVPACGYRTVKLSPGTPPAAATNEPSGTTIESKFYRITFDPATGGITSIVDKETNTELVDPQAPYRFNEYLYVTNPPKTDLYRDKIKPALTINTPSTAKLTRKKLGNLGEEMIVETSAAQTPRIVSTITVWQDIKRVDIENRLNKTATLDQEAAYFAFPFAGTQPVFRYEIPCGVVREDKDMIPGACRAWFTAQHFVQVDSTAGSVTWSSPDAPLVCFQDINRGTWPTALTLGNGYLYSYVMNNYWWTNYKASQGGDFIFRYAFTSQAKSDTAQSTHFGAEVAAPLLATARPAGSTGLLTEAASSLLQVEEPNVLLFGLPRSETEDGVVLHLRETAGQQTLAHIKIGALGVHQATMRNLIETPEGPLPIQDGAIEVPLRPWAVVAVKIK